MARYHIISKVTGLVEDANKYEALTLAEASAKYPDKIVVLSEMGKPNKPNIMPGFLWHDGIFWAPQRAPKALTEGQPSLLERDDFLSLFELGELLDIFNYEFDTSTDTKTEKASNKDKRRARAAISLMQVMPKIRVPSATATEIVQALLNVNLITSKRAAEVAAVKIKRS